MNDSLCATPKTPLYLEILLHNVSPALGSFDNDNQVKRYTKLMSQDFSFKGCHGAKVI